MSSHPDIEQNIHLIDERKRQIALVGNISLWLIIAIVLPIIFNILQGYYIVSILLCLTELFLIYVFIKKGNIKSPLLVLSFIALLLVIVMMISKHGTHSVLIIAIPGIIFVASFGLNRWVLLITTIISIISIWVIGFLEINNIIHNEFSQFTNLAYLITVSILILTVSKIADKFSNDYLFTLDELKSKAALLIEANKKLSEQSLARSKFFSILTHDLKSPFQALFGFSNIMVEEFTSLTDNEKLEMLQKLNLTIKSQYEFLNQLVLWWQYQSGFSAPCNEFIDGEKIISSVLEIYTPIAEQKNIKLKSECSNRGHIPFNSEIIKMILRNLLSNAIKYTPKEGWVDIKLLHDEEKLNLIVEDSGIGISEDALAKLFNLENCLSTRGTENETGHGLGLIFCKEIIEKHGGRINIESKLCIGTKFTVCLPLKLSV